MLAISKRDDKGDEARVLVRRPHQKIKHFAAHSVCMRAFVRIQRVQSSKQTSDLQDECEIIAKQRQSKT